MGPTQCLGLSPSSSCLSPWPSQSNANTIPVARGVSPLPLFPYEWRSTPPHWQDPRRLNSFFSLFNSRKSELFWSPGNLTLKEDSDLTESKIFIEVKSRFWLDVARDVYRHSFRHSWSEDESRHLLPLRHPWLLPPFQNPFWDLDGDVPSDSQSRTNTCNRHRAPFFTRFSSVSSNYLKSMDSMSSVNRPFTTRNHETPYGSCLEIASRKASHSSRSPRRPEVPQSPTGQTNHETPITNQATVQLSNVWATFSQYVAQKNQILFLRSNRATASNFQAPRKLVLRRLSVSKLGWNKLSCTIQDHQLQTRNVLDKATSSTFNFSFLNRRI